MDFFLRLCTVSDSCFWHADLVCRTVEFLLRKIFNWQLCNAHFRLFMFAYIGHVYCRSKQWFCWFYQFDKLPYEVCEPILQRAAVLLFKANRVHLLKRSDTMAVVTISCVCRNWFEVITGWKFVRRRLKLIFRKVGDYVILGEFK